MKKIALTLGLLTAAVFANAADPLHGTTWKTIDDETKQPRAVVKFTEQADGKLSASIQSVLAKGEENTCTKCTGKFKNKSLKGVTIVRNLQNVGGMSYEGGTILDPKTDKTYKLKGKIADGGKKLELRGFIGVSVLGRNQTWVRMN